VSNKAVMFCACLAGAVILASNGNGGFAMLLFVILFFI
jgi:hypothetical protein